VDADPSDFDSPDFESPDDVGADRSDFDPSDFDPSDFDPSDFDPSDAGSLPFDSPATAFLVGAPEDRRSFLAHPLPLKTMVGGANARLTGPSHSGHWWGPDSLRPRKTSNRWPQEVQT
jgi:hypothetical protein